MLTCRWLLLVASLVPPGQTPAAKPAQTDVLRSLQDRAIAEGRSPVAHWGSDPAKYTEWSTHSNRLIPVYTFGTQGAGAGIDLASYSGRHSVYRSAEGLARLYGAVPPQTLDPDAEYLDQTNIYDLQRAALKAGKRNIILVVFDGMGREATRAAAVYRSGNVYHGGRGTGLFFLDHRARDTTQFGYMVTSPYAEDAKVDVDAQTVRGIERQGGYDPKKAGRTPWDRMADAEYIKGTKQHAYTDSASSATSMSAGIKTYNAAINVAVDGSQVETIAHQAQKAGYAVGVVSSVPISHATPAAMYSHNVHRSDYQDLSRDLVGLPSVSHPSRPLPGVDVLLGAGFGVEDTKGKGQGSNFVPGNPFLTKPDAARIRWENGGEYVVSERTAGCNGREKLLADARRAIETKRRLFGFYGTKYGHLPYRTADGDYRPATDKGGSAEIYAAADVAENPTLADMAEAALMVLEKRAERRWILVEAGDVDFAKHNNNLDNMIGAVLSGDEAVRRIANWVETNSDWSESVMIVTADHGHYLVIDDIEALAVARRPRR